MHTMVNQPIAESPRKCQHGKQRKHERRIWSDKRHSCDRRPHQSSDSAEDHKPLMGFRTTSKEQSRTYERGKHGNVSQSDRHEFDGATEWTTRSPAVTRSTDCDCDAHNYDRRGKYRANDSQPFVDADSAVRNQGGLDD